ncbi:F-box domain-containing protein [Mycena sanguinolenta]|uniref:F-box domain-containing protein n=1 Tax=Mycena sanguinolenta TaxID=230812 RepID=A0A8H7CPR2_9AGAR|nr:F-box domain-containing protein [Mycena sanguinolenta]
MPCSQPAASFISNPEEYDLNLALSQQRISQFLATNECPQDHELALIRPVAQKTTSRLAFLDAEISRLKDQLSRLEKEHTVLMKYHAQNTAILSPMRRVPAEILGEIFCWSLSLFSVPNLKYAPWVLTHVSRRWRAVTISRSSLWSHIYLDFTIKKKYSLAMVRTQIERARTLQISFVGHRGPDSHLQVDMLQLLLHHSSICEEIYLILTPALVASITGWQGHFPLLRRAWLQCDGQEAEASIDSVDFFAIAPSLADITVYSEHHFIPTLLPAHHRITRYDFAAPWSTHYELLKSLPNLREVRIVRRFDRGVPWPKPGQPIHLLHLQKMYVSSPECLDYLSAPVLREIAIRPRKHVDTRNHLERFITRSSCIIRRLCIVGTPEVQPVEEILSQYPSIAELALRIIDIKQNEKTECDVLTTFLTRFTISDSARILPHISKLDFGCDNPEAISYPLYVNMLHSRWNAPDCALVAAELSLPNGFVDPDPESFSRMEALRQAGMQVSFLMGDVAEDRADQWLYIVPWVAPADWECN